jgi:membrane protein DedA with SNARE-associated domain
VAGAARLPRTRFHLYNGIGSLVWIIVMLLAGVVSMRTFNWMEVFTRSSKWSIGFIGACSVLMAGYSWWKRKQSKEQRATAEQASLSHVATVELHPSGRE